MTRTSQASHAGPCLQAVKIALQLKKTLVDQEQTTIHQVRQRVACYPRYCEPRVCVARCDTCSANAIPAVAMD